MQDIPAVTAPFSSARSPLSFLLWFLLLGGILAAFLLRVHNLAYESLEIDEADAFYLALADFPTLVGRMMQPGENGPLYFLLLRLWIGLAGTSEFALRYFSLLPAVLAIPLMFVVGRRLAGPRVGLIAALLFVPSSYLLYYAQMTKMYSLVLLLSLLSSYLFLRALERPSARWWAAYTGVTTLALYTHVFGALLIPWHALFALLTIKQHRRALVPWLVSLGFLTLPYLPLGLQRMAAIAAPASLNRQFTGPQNLVGMVATLAREYGTRYDLLPGPLLSGFFLALALGGVVALLVAPPATNKSRLPLLFITLGALIPLLASYTLVMLGVPLFASRYLIITLPMFYLLWAAALAALAARSRPLALAVLVVFILLNGARWAQTAFAGMRFHEDWRGAVAYLEQRYVPGDAVLVLHENAAHAVRYYASKPLALTSLDAGPGQPPNPEKASGMPSAERIWLVAAYFEADDLPPVQRWLDASTHPVGQQWVPGVMVNQYVSNATPSGGAATRAPLATFDGKLDLKDYRPLPPPDQPGAPWQIFLEWQASQALQEDYRLLLRLEDSQARAWGQSEGPVGGLYYPTPGWPAGFSVRVVQEIEMAPGAPAGEYTLKMQLYREGQEEPLRVDAAGGGSSNELALGVLTLADPVPAKPPRR